MSEVIRHEVEFNASPEKIYEALTDAKAFSGFTGMPAEFDAKEGSKISGFGGMITGYMVELKPGKRVVQAWRSGNWGEGEYSIVRFELESKGSGTSLKFTHSGYPSDQKAHLDSGWKERYWQPLQNL